MGYSSTEVPATDFAITTVNVPDRLDMRDMSDRKDVEDRESNRLSLTLSDLRAWLPMVTLALIVLIVGVLLWRSSRAGAFRFRRLRSRLGWEARSEFL